MRKFFKNLFEIIELILDTKKLKEFFLKENGRIC